MKKNITPQDFAQRLTSWYQLHARSLPWRENPTSYTTWLSEIILQQTRIQQGLPYYRRFLRAFPTLHHLARASQQEVLRLWQGLGYYRRGINLLRCAQKIASEHQGKFPTSADNLRKLPGIGPYTSAAIASIINDEPIAAVDGNVYRVLTRIFGIQEDIRATSTQKKIKALAQSLLDARQPGTFNQALMEFGALHCTPAQPKCDLCPFEDICIAKQKGLQRQLPVKSKKKPLKNRYFHYFVFTYQQKTYLRKRRGKDIWHGLYDFYLVEKNHPQPLHLLRDNLIAHLRDNHLTIYPLPAYYKHLLTHQRIHVSFFHVPINQAFTHLLKDVVPFSLVQIETLPLPIPIAKFLKDHLSTLLSAKPTPQSVEIQ